MNRFFFKAVYGPDDGGGNNQGNNQGNTGTSGNVDTAAIEKAAADKAAADKAAAATAAGNNNNNNNNNNGGGDPNDPYVRLKFTPEQQDFMNRKIAEEKRQAQQQNQRTIDELKKLQLAAGTTEQQKNELQNRINELNRQFLSKEELAKQEADRAAKEFQQQLNQHKTEAEKWQKMFYESTITRSLMDGAAEFEAFNANQIVDLLKNKTKLVHEKDVDGNETGNMIPRIQLQESDSDGKPMLLDLTVKEALQKMRNTPDRYGNLFKSTLAGGLGQGGNQGAGKKKVDPAKMTTQEWMEFRKKNPNFAGV